MNISNIYQGREKILVLGAAGKTGFTTAMELINRGKRVRAFVHRQDERSDALESAGAEIITGEMSDYEDISKSLVDIEKAYFVAPWVADQLHIATTFAVAAAKSDLKLIVAITQWLAQPRHPSLATRQSYLTDKLFDMLPGIDVIKINTGWFADNFLQPELLAMVTQLGIFPLPLGDGYTAPISNEDLGRVAAEVLTNPVPYTSRTIRPAGPDMMSPEDLVDSLSKAAGRRVKFINISNRLFQKAMQYMGMPVHMQAQVRRYVEDYRRGSFELGAPNNVVPEITGMAAEDFETIARRYIDKYPDVTRSTFVNKLKAIRGFIRLIFTHAIDLDRFESDRAYPKPVNPAYSIENAVWVKSHREQHQEMLTGDYRDQTNRQSGFGTE